MKLIVERQVACKNSAKSGRAGKKKRDLEKELPTEKVDLLCKRLREQGLWQYDEDWPQDEEDIPYYIFSLGQNHSTQGPKCYREEPVVQTLPQSNFL